MTAPHMIDSAGSLGQALSGASPDLMRHVAWRSLASAAATPPGEPHGLDDPAGQYRMTRLEPLTHDLQAEFREDGRTSPGQGARR